MANCTSLTRLATAMHIHLDVEMRDIVSQLQRLANHHQPRFTGKIFVGRLAIDDDLASARFDEHTRHCTLATAGSVIVVTDHVYSLNFECLRLLSGMRM